MTSQSINWKQHFNSLVSNEEANKTMDDFSNAIAAAKNQLENLRAITEDRNAIISSMALGLIRSSALFSLDLKRVVARAKKVHEDKNSEESMPTDLEAYKGADALPS